MNTERFDFDIDPLEDGQVVVLSNFKGLIRSRWMPNEMLEKLVRLFREIRTGVAELLPGVDQANPIPHFPDCRLVASGRIGDVCNVRAVASRNADDEIEVILGLYDADDDSCPVIVLIDDQIEQFANLADEVLKRTTAQQN